MIGNDWLVCQQTGTEFVGDARPYLCDTLSYVLCDSHHQKFDHRQGIESSGISLKKLPLSKDALTC